MSALPLRRKKSACLLVWHGSPPWKSSGNVAYLSRAPTSSNVKELGSDELTEAGTPLVLMDAWLFTFSGGKSIAVILYPLWPKLTQQFTKLGEYVNACRTSFFNQERSGSSSVRQIVNSGLQVLHWIGCEPVGLVPELVSLRLICETVPGLLKTNLGSSWCKQKWRIGAEENQKTPNARRRWSLPQQHLALLWLSEGGARPAITVAE